MTRKKDKDNEYCLLGVFSFFVLRRLTVCAFMLYFCRVVLCCVVFNFYVLCYVLFERWEECVWIGRDMIWFENIAVRKWNLIQLFSSEFLQNVICMRVVFYVCCYDWRVVVFMVGFVLLFFIRVVWLDEMFYEICLINTE